MRKQIAIGIIGIIATLGLTACRTSSNSVTYLQDSDTSQTTDMKVLADYPLRIAPDDQLQITVSGTEPDAVAVFNMPLTTHQKAGEMIVSSTPVLYTYQVSSSGEIDFPILGRLKVDGLTTSQLSDTLTRRIGKYVKSPIVSTRISNFKVSVLGEVNRPGTLQITSERLSVLDAIGMAGDLTIQGNRKNVLLVRDNNGRQELHRLDLTSTSLFASPCYYLQQNDVLYIEPNKARQKDTNISQNRQQNLTLVSTIISALSVLASLGIAFLVK